MENDTIWRVLKELKIDYGQGYYLGKPGPFDEAIISTVEHRFNNRKNIYDAALFSSDIF